MTDCTGNLPPLPGVFSDYAAPIVRNQHGSSDCTDATLVPEPLQGETS